MSSFININKPSAAPPRRDFRQLSYSQQPDRVTFSGKKSFTCDINVAMDELRAMKNAKGEQKFNEEKLEILKSELIKNPKKWDAIKSLAQDPKMISAIVCELAQTDLEEVNIINNLSRLKTEENTPRFRILELKKLSNALDPKELNKIATLAKTDLDIDKIIDIANNSKLKNLDELVNKVNKLADFCGDDLMSISFFENRFDSNSYTIKADMQNNNSKIIVVDQNLETQTIEDTYFEHAQSKTYMIRKSRDLRNNTTSKVRMEVSKRFPTPVTTNEIIVFKDKENRILKKEDFELSVIPGVPNIRHIDKDGEVKNISSGTINPKTGILTIKKDMESSNGVKTQYEYSDDPSGNRIMDYKITDKNGKVLMNLSKTFEVISENKFISSNNDKSYEINLSDTSLAVTDLQSKNTTIIEFNKLMNGECKKLKRMLKQVPGDELIAMNSSVNELNEVDDSMKSTFSGVTKTIKTGDNLFTMLHELGHAKNFKNVDVKDKSTLCNFLYEDKHLQKLYKQEKEAFDKAFPNTQREHINYFIENSENKDKLEELIAETNAILNTRSSEDIFSIRTHYLQQHFPETIAYLAKKL